MAKSDVNNYGIVKWFVEHEDVNLKKYSDYFGSINEIAKEEAKKGKPQAKAYLDSSKSDYLNDTSTELGKNAKEVIDNVNKEWSENVINKVEGAANKEDLESIKDNDLEPNRENYNEGTIKGVEQAIKEKEAGLPPPIDKARIKELESSIDKAKTQDDIDNMFTRGELRRELGKKEAQRIIDLSEERASDLRTLSEGAYDNTLDEISKATTEDQIYGISGRLTDIPNLTTELRRELAREIRAKLKEISG